MPATYTISVDGMHCASCGLLIDDALADVPGVRASQTSVRAGAAIVELSDGAADPAGLIAAITELGYAATITSTTNPPGDA